MLIDTNHACDQIMHVQRCIWVKLCSYNITNHLTSKLKFQLNFNIRHLMLTFNARHLLANSLIVEVLIAVELCVSVSKFKTVISNIYTQITPQHKFHSRQGTIIIHLLLSCPYNMEHLICTVFNT